MRTYINKDANERGDVLIDTLVDIAIAVRSSLVHEYGDN